jgi:adenylate cyclase
MQNASEERGTTGLFSIMKNRPLRVDILTAFIGLLVMTVVVIILHAYIRNSKAVLALTDDMIHQAGQTVLGKAVSFLEPVSDMARLSAHIASHFNLALPENQAFETYAIEVLKAYPQVTMFNISDEKGNFLMPKRMPDWTIATKIINRNQIPAKETWKYRNILDQVVMTESSIEVDYDPRDRPWYEGAKKTGKTFWTDLYIFFSDNEPGITAAHPVINQRGECLGVFGLDIHLSEMSDFLKSLKIGKSGIAFIVNSKNELVAFPDISRIAMREGDLPRPVKIHELEEHWIKAFHEETKKREAHRYFYASGGQRFIGARISFPAFFAKDWKIVIIVPEDDFIGTLKKTRMTSIMISAIVLLIAIACAALLSQSISKPILLVAREAEKIKDFDLQGEMALGSRIREIQVLEGAVKRMKASLRSFTRYAPEEIVKEVVAKGREAVLGGEKRRVTLLFSDLRGFTSFSEKTRPEDVVSLLNDHFDLMVNIISQHGGFVVDFLGDSVFAVFGALKEDPEHTTQAVTCAVEMQLARMNLNEENRVKGLPPMEMGIGINSGPCVVGNMGSHMRIKYGIVGHAVNLGARIESFTVGGQVLISDTTYHEVNNQINTTGPFEVWGKGVGEAIRIWEVRGLKKESSIELPPTVPDLVRLPQPVTVTYRIIRGKEISPETYTAQLDRLAISGAEIKTDQALEIFFTLQIHLSGIHDKEAPSMDGKIVGLGTKPNHFVVRFSGTGPAQAAAIRHILERGM